MNLLFDINIILSSVRDKTGFNLMNYLNPDKKIVYVSFTNVAEIQSIALQNAWGTSKLNHLSSFFEEVRIIDISDLLLETYIDIDSFSQRNHPDFKNYNFKTPRNMGKNDLYIAATVSVLNLFLVTMDADFDHLHDVFLKVNRILPQELQQVLK